MKHHRSCSKRKKGRFAPGRPPCVSCNDIPISPGEMADSSIKVCVRCRPLNSRELARASKSIIRIEGTRCRAVPRPRFISSSGNTCYLDPDKLNASKSFTFDRAFDSQDKSSPSYASQEVVFDYLGKDLLEAAFSGYNTWLDFMVTLGLD
jgi:hypothetical protein